MKDAKNLLFSIVGSLIVIEIIRQYETWIAYFLYAAIFLGICLNVFIYWRNRIKFEITKQDFTNDSPPSLFFTATNMGDHRNSLDKRVILKWLNIPLSETFPCGNNHKDILTIDRSDNYLDPHETKRFKATIKGDMSQLYFSNFMQYRFTPNRGMYTYLRFITPHGKNVSFLRFYFKKFLYRFFKIGLVYKPDRPT